MDNPTPHITDLSPHLFLDTDRSALDFESAAALIIHRVLEYGVMSDWKIIRQVYGMDRIRDVAVQLRTLDNVTLAFLCTIFHLEKTDFRCYILRQSTQTFE